MKKTLFLLLLVVLPLVAAAQKYRTIELKPITKQGWQYYYDLKKVSSPVALEVPLLSLNDPEVNQYTKAYKGWNTASGLVTIIPLIYFISLPNNSSLDSSTFWWVIGGTIAAQLGMSAVANVKLGKAIDKYNMIILQPSGRSLGVEVTYRFW